MLQAPADVFTGRVTGVAIVAVLLRQVLWLALTLVTGQVVQRLGTRYLVVQGG